MKTLEQPEIRRLPMSYEAYLAYGDDTTRTEWVNGEVIVYMPPRDEHQTILEFLERLLALFVDLNELGRVRVAPFEVKLWEGGPSREPDIMFVSQASLENLDSRRFSGAPELAVEIVSPGSLYIDRNEKFREYERAGVSEYWLIDSRPGQTRADFYRLDETGRFDLFATEADERVDSSAVKNFWLRPAWLWQPPPPSDRVCRSCGQGRGHRRAEGKPKLAHLGAAHPPIP